MKEVAPFLGVKTTLEKSAPIYKEIIDFLFTEIYTAPFGQKLDYKGKVRDAGL